VFEDTRESLGPQPPPFKIGARQRVRGMLYEDSGHSPAPSTYGPIPFSMWYSNLTQRHFALKYYIRYNERVVKVEYESDTSRWVKRRGRLVRYWEKF